MLDLGNTPGAQPLIPYILPTQPSGLISNTMSRRVPGQLIPNLDSPAATHLHGSLMGHYQREIDVQAPWRFEKATDERFYDNDPWSDEEKAVLRARGQTATNYNVIATSINWLIGTERRSRTDFKVLPRKKDGAAAAMLKTKLLKYLSDANHSEFAMSQAYSDCIKTGLGWIESGWQADDDGEPVYDRVESWRNILQDSLSRDPGFHDGRYIFRMKWCDMDMAVKTFPERQNLLERSVADNYMGGTDTYGDEYSDEAERSQAIGYNGSGGSLAGARASARDRVRLLECWFRAPVPSQIVMGGQFSGDLFDIDSTGHRASIDRGEAGLTTRLKMRTHCAIMTTMGLLHFQESPYRHNRSPFTPVYCYRKGSTGESYGVIRNLRDLQTNINMAGSKAQHILATNKTVMEKGAVDDLQEFQTEVARPDAIIVTNPGKRVELGVDRQLAPAHLDLMARQIQMVQQTSGITDENMGRETNAKSGKAIVARQDQGSLATAEPLDNYRYARQIHGEKMLSLGEQFETAEKEFRITNARGSAEHVTINNGELQNDIARTKADFIITDQQFNASIIAQNSQILADFVGTAGGGNPQLQLILLDLIAEGLALPNSDEIVKRIRQISGMKDPDADPNTPPSPEDVAAEKQKAEEADIQKRAIMAKIGLDEAAIKKTMADAGQSDAKAETLVAGLPGINLDVLIQAITAALATLQTPHVIPMADDLAKSAGYARATPAVDPNAAMLPPPAAMNPMAPPAGMDGMAQPPGMDPMAQPPGMDGIAMPPPEAAMMPRPPMNEAPPAIAA